MYSYNITFVVEPSGERALLEYIRGNLLSKLFNDQSPARNPQIKKVTEVAGQEPDSDHGLSLALSADFASEESAHLWHDHILIPSLGEFHAIFGAQALFFVTLLEILPL